MSASTRTAPAQLSFGRVPSALAALALVVILAVAVAIVALNGTKVAAPAKAGSVGAPPPIGYDHGSSNGETVFLPKNISHFGGWGGPSLGSTVNDRLKGEVVLGDSTSAVGNDGPKPVAPSTTRGGHNGTRRDQ